LRAGAKCLAARAGNADPRAAKNWLDGRNLPQLSHAIDLMAADPLVEEEILSMVRSRREELCQKLASKSWRRSAPASASDFAIPAE
jgi:hypothetical protein